ncbi:MAG: AMP-binding protein [Candidatus Didemnitutus sp.]|nr:AMP-binding protein [Candidatus Didemnitutus sp.]
MNEATDRDWLIDARSGLRTKYAELLARLNARTATLRPCFQPASTNEALVEVTLAVARDADLTLFDHDFGAREIEALGYSTVQLNQPTTMIAGGTLTIASLAQLAAGGSRARLGLFTSGSTGLPKLVWQSVANLARAVKVSTRHAEAIWAFAYNPTHVAGIQVYLQALANGCTVVDVQGLDRAGVLDALSCHRVTHISATPSFYRLLLPVDRSLPGVRSVTLGGERADGPLVAKVSALFPNARVHNVYASTEAGTLLVADGDVFAIAPGLEGRIAVREGQLNVHRALLGEFAGCPLAGDWYATGDMVEIVSEQPLRFRIVARERDWVNVGGSKVNPHEVEAVLAAHPGVGQVRVLGRKNSVMGHILCAEIVLLDAFVGLVTETEIRAYAAERLQPFKIPRIIRFVSQLATTRTGKLSRT